MPLPRSSSTTAAANSAITAQDELHGIAGTVPHQDRLENARASLRDLGDILVTSAGEVDDDQIILGHRRSTFDHLRDGFKVISLHFEVAHPAISLRYFK